MWMSAAGSSGGMRSHRLLTIWHDALVAGGQGGATGLWPAVVVVLSMLASLVPALRAARVSVREALAYECTNGRIGLALKAGHRQKENDK